MLMSHSHRGEFRKIKSRTFKVTSRAFKGIESLWRLVP